jgi:hypothetical protein
MPVVAAALLTVAAGWSLAEEHARPSAAGPSASSGSRSNATGTRAANNKARPENGNLAKERGTDSSGTGDGGQAKSSGVGSRALIGNDNAHEMMDQPEMATGLDLKGPPVRFPAGDTPE